METSSVITWIINNKEWLFSGLGITIVGLLYRYFLKPKNNHKGEADDAKDNFKPTNNVNINVSTNNNVTKNDRNSTPVHNNNSKSKSNSNIKAITHILFIDDNNFPIVTSLKRAGWVNTKLKKKITSIDDPLILDSHIIFVDIVGVCKELFKDEGLGLARALKEKYGDQKKIILYSAETEGNRFDKTIRMVDEALPKNAEVYEFIDLVDRFAQEIWKED